MALTVENDFYISRLIVDDVIHQSINGVPVPIMTDKGLATFREGLSVPRGIQNMGNYGDDYIGIYENFAPRQAYMRKPTVDQVIEGYTAIKTRKEYSALTDKLKERFPEKVYSHPVQIQVIDRTGDPIAVRYEIGELIILSSALQNQFGAVKSLLIETAATAYGMGNHEQDAVSRFNIEEMDKNNPDFVELVVATEERNGLFADSGLRWRSSSIMAAINRRAKTLALNFIRHSILK